MIDLLIPPQEPSPLDLTTGEDTLTVPPAPPADLPLPPPLDDPLPL